MAQHGIAAIYVDFLAGNGDPTYKGDGSPVRPFRTIAEIPPEHPGWRVNDECEYELADNSDGQHGNR